MELPTALWSFRVICEIHGIFRDISEKKNSSFLVEVLGKLLEQFFSLNFEKTCGG